MNWRPAGSAAAVLALMAQLFVFTAGSAGAALSPDSAASPAACGGSGDAARPRWTTLAQGYDPRSDLERGLQHDFGQGMPRNPGEAYRYYLRAAEAGQPDAQFNVAVMNDTGDGVRRDIGSAALWYARSAAHGNRRAQFNLAQLYAAGDGVPRNLHVAAAWFRAAGLPAAATRLAAVERASAAASPPRTSEQPRRETADDAPVPAQPVQPADGSCQGRAGEALSEVELVWAAPPRSAQLRFFVQVVRLVEGTVQEAFARQLDETAVLVRLPRGAYAWRVYAVGSNAQRYAASGWARFLVAGRRRPGRRHLPPGAGRMRYRARMRRNCGKAWSRCGG